MNKCKKKYRWHSLEVNMTMKKSSGPVRRVDTPDDSFRSSVDRMKVNINSALLTLPKS